MCVSVSHDACSCHTHDEKTPAAPSLSFHSLTLTALVLHSVYDCGTVCECVCVCANVSMTTTARLPSLRQQQQQQPCSLSKRDRHARRGREHKRKKGRRQICNKSTRRRQASTTTAAAAATGTCITSRGSSRGEREKRREVVQKSGDGDEIREWIYTKGQASSSSSS